MKGENEYGKERFIENYIHGAYPTSAKIIVDTETGVNYLLLSSNMTSGCGVAVLVDKDGKPIITSVDGKDSI